VCTCAGVAPPVDSGYFISINCVEVDIDECSVHNGGCHENAYCTNLDATTGQGKRQCTCPTDWRGDGITECRWNQYTTEFEFIRNSAVSVDQQELYQELVDLGVLPPNLPLETLVISTVPIYSS
jgi:hypothetical protein